ncbi:hypothetical protein JXA32_14565 [Candidatus Sumerlaeota bacterium]|nr:hypothetical protein [Candidatus Sumerlaeota bacterium]
MNKIIQFFKQLFRRVRAPWSDGFLCDSCRYDYGGVCNRPERPNATECPDYKRK